jgi:hypothetical protein
MRSSNIIELAFPQQGYGPEIRPTKFGERVYEANQEDIEIYKKTNAFVADWLAGSDVRDLEKVATAYYVTRRNPRDPLVGRTKKINSLKPHVDVFAAEEALKIADKKREEAKRSTAAQL